VYGNTIPSDITSQLTSEKSWPAVRAYRICILMQK